MAMSEVLMVLFEVLPDGGQQVISSQTFNSRDEALVAFDHMTNSIFVGPGCHAYQIDLVDRQSITDLVEVYIPNTNDAINWGNQTWASWKALKTGDVVTIPLGGDFTNSHPSDDQCSALPPTDTKLDDFTPTPVPPGQAHELDLSTAAVGVPVALVATDPTNPAPSPLVALTEASRPVTPELAMTGGHGAGLAEAGLLLMVVGAALVTKAKSLARRHV